MGKIRKSERPYWTVLKYFYPNLYDETPPKTLVKIERLRLDFLCDA